VTTNPTVADPSAETTFDRGRDLTRRAALSAAARLLGLIIAAVLSLSPVSARAQIYWQVPAGDWSTVANWGSVVPTGTDAAYIVNGGTATVTQLNATCGTLSLGGSTGSGSVQMTGGSLSVNCDETVGDSGTGTFNQSGGTNSVANDLYLGNNTGSSGTYNLGGNGQLVATDVNVGNAGTGTFTQSGGCSTVNALSVGPSAGGSGSYFLSGSGSLSVGGEYVGDGGNASFTQSGGTNSVSNTLSIAGSNASNASYSLNGNGLLTAASESIGTSFAGSFTQTSGTNSVSGLLSIDAGAYTLGGNGLLTAPTEYVGSSSSPSSFIQTGGTHCVTSALWIGSFSAGTYSLSGNGMLTAPCEYLSYAGTGSFVQSGGTNSVSNELYVACGSNNVSGTYSLSGTGTLTAPNECIGYYGQGVFTQSGGSNNVTNSLYLGFISGSSGTFNLSGGGQLSAAAEYVGYDGSDGNGTGLFTQSGGTNTVSLLSIGNKSRYLLAGGTLQINGSFVSAGTLAGAGTPASLSGNGILNLSGGSLQNLGALSLSVAPNSLLIVPPGFNPATSFASYSNLGMTHTNGTTLNVPAGQGFGGFGSISDGVTCQGTITATSGNAINLLAGLQLSGTGTINLGNGRLTSYDTISGISGGLLSVGQQSVESGIFTQTGGSNTVSELSIAIYATYMLAGGTLQINGNLANQGIFTGGATPSTLIGNSVLDLSSGTWQDLGAVSLSMGPTSLLILPAGFNPSTTFASYASLGLTHTNGTTLSVPAGSEFIGSLAMADPIICQGTILATSGSSINSTGGLTISGTGAVNLGNGTLTTNDLVSGISGGSLATCYQYVGNGGSGTFTQSGGTSNVSYFFALGEQAGNSGTYLLSGNSQLSARLLYIGDLGSGTLTQSGGTNTVTNYLYLAYNRNSNGAYNLSGSSQLSAPNEVIGYYGIGNFTQTGGSNAMSNGLWVGGAVGGSAYNLSGNSQLSASTEYVGGTAGASFTQSAGTNSIVNTLSVSGSAGNSSTYSLGGSGFLSAGIESIGVSGTGAFTQSGGINSAGTLNLGDNIGSTGTYSLSGGQLSATLENVANASGVGSFTQSGGTNNVAGNLNIYGWNTGSGTYNLCGNGLLSASNEVVGVDSGAFIQSGGTNSVANYLYVGNAASNGGGGSYSLSGGGQLSAGSECIGYSGTGSFTQSAGTNSVSTVLYVGWYGGPAMYNLSGSGQLSAASEYIGYPITGPGTFTQSGGTNCVSNGLHLGGYGAGTYNLSGGELILASLIGSGAAAFNFNGGTMQASNSFSTNVPMTLGTSGGGATFDTGGFSVTLAGSLSGPGSLTKIGAGTLFLSGSNTYTGATTVSAGTLEAAGATALPSYATQGTITVANGATLAVAVGGNGWTSAGIGTLLGRNSGGFAGGSILGIDTSGGSLSYGSNIAGNMGLALWGGNTLVLTAANTYTGPTTITAGTLQVGNGGSGASIGGTSGVTDNASLVFNHAGTVTFSPVISGSGSLTQTGSGKLVIVGANTYSGPTTITGGTLQIDNGGSTGSLGNGPITNNAALVFDRDDNGLVVANAISGSGSLAQIGGGMVTLCGTNAYTGNTLISAGTLALGNNLLLQNSTLNISGTGALGFGGFATATIGGLTGGGNLVLTNTADAAVALSVGANNSSTIYSGLLSDNATGGSLNKVGSGTLTLTAADSYTGPTIITAGTLQIGNAGSGASIGGTSGVTDNASLVFNHADTATFSPVISGSGSLTQSGAGILVLTGANTYSGPTTISAGTLQIDRGGTIGAPGSGPIANNGTLVFDRGDNSLVVTNIISGSGSLVQSGTGILTLGGANFYTGNTLVSTGTLALANSLAIQNSTLVTSGTGVLSFGGLAAATVGGLSGGGGLVLSNTAGMAVALSVGASNEWH
jgi:autotransporter-associated beta strand protein